MPIVQTANDWTVGIAKQTDETTIPTVAAYDFPVFAGRPKPIDTLQRLEVTDAAGITGDPFKGNDAHWDSDGLSVPAFANMMGLLLVPFWTDDTMTGTTPRVHTFSALGTGTPVWTALFNKQAFTGNLPERYEASLLSALTFSFDSTGGPLRLLPTFVGKKVSNVNTSWTTTTPAVLADGYFTATGGVLKFEEDNATPATQTNIRNVSLTVQRSVTPEPTAESTSVNQISVGKLEFPMSMELLWNNWDAYRASYFGAVAGTSSSAVVVAGSAEFNFVHTVQAGWAFKITIPKIVIRATPPEPNAAGGPLTVPTNPEIMKPTSGDHVQPILTNQVTTAYDA